MNEEVKAKKLDSTLTQSFGLIKHCLEHMLHRLDDQKNYSKISNTSISGSAQIEPETYTITKVCFALALLAALLHVLLLMFFRGIRVLYGFSIVAGCYWLVVSHLTILISCTVQPGTQAHRIASSVADFALLTTVASNLLSGIALFRQIRRDLHSDPYDHNPPSNRVDNKSRSIHYQYGDSMRRQCVSVCVYVVGTVGLSLVIVLFDAYFVTYGPLDLDEVGRRQESFHNLTCNIIPDSRHFIIFFPTLAALFTLQLICVVVCAKLCYGCTQQHSLCLLEDKPHLTVRFWLITKLGTTHLCVWTSAFLAVYFTSTSMWHIFILFISLQSIFITVNSTFSRPVLELVYHCQDGIDKMDNRKIKQILLEHMSKAEDMGNHRANLTSNA